LTFVRVEGLIKIYRTKTTEVVALRGVNLSVPQGGVAVITGPSGSGKTSLLNVIAGLEPPSAGSVSVKGLRVNDLSDSQLADYRRNVVGYIFQSFNLVSFLTVSQNVALPMYLNGSSAADCRQRSEDLLESVGLASRAGRFPRSLSGGEQQRAAIATALCNDPPVILADEPTAELDTEAGAAILGLLSDLSQSAGRTLLLVSHDERANRIGGSHYRIIDGTLSADNLDAVDLRSPPERMSSHVGHE